MSSRRTMVVLHEGARLAGVGFAALTSVAIGQAVLHERTYRPLPQFDGAPTIGRELPEKLRRMADKTRETRSELARRLKAKQREVRDSVLLASERRRLPGLSSESWRERLDGIIVKRRPQNVSGAAPQQDDSDDTVSPEDTSERASSDKALSRTLSSSSATAQNKPSYRVLFIGDSLVTGIGGAEADAREGPPLPRRVCRALAEKLGVQVEWRALGLTGGDLPALRERLVPELRDLVARDDDDDEVVSHSSQQQQQQQQPCRTTPSYDVVVVMCGLNDFKWLARGQLRTPWAFRDELEALLDDIRGVVGHDARIVLPALPVALASFREPLKSYVIFLANRWDDQKKRLADVAAAAQCEEEDRNDDDDHSRWVSLDSHRESQHDDDVSAAAAVVEKRPRRDDVAHDSRRRFPALRRVEFVDACLRIDDAARDVGLDLVAPDGVHPSERGYEHWAQHIAAALVASTPPPADKQKHSRRDGPPDGRDERADGDATAAVRRADAVAVPPGYV